MGLTAAGKKRNKKQRIFNMSNGDRCNKAKTKAT